MKKVELVFIPAPGAGHLVPTLQFAKRLIDRNDRISITILAIQSFYPTTLSSYTKSIAASEPRIRFIDVPQPQYRPPQEMYKSRAKIFSLYIESHVPSVKKIITNLVSSSANSSDSIRVAALVVDLFCVSMIDVAKELNIPSYLFLTSNTGYLAFMLNLPILHEKNQIAEESDPDWSIPGIVHPVPPRVLPVALTDGSCSAYIKLASRFRETRGIIVNTFVELETHAITLFSNDDRVPSLYPVGPVIDLDDGQAHSNLDQAQRDKIIKWLDDQPQKSVVFLCFGSMGSFGAEQVKEIALGLEQSGQRFLWSLRMPSPKGTVPSDCSNLEEVLPDGFLERTNGKKGLICGWAPQVEVLTHSATGGFLSHCGWNSILESLWHGVPIATWPMYAEQQLNAFWMVRELGMALEMRLDYKTGSADVVGADEIERAVVGVMEKDSEVRKKVEEMGKMARKAVKDGGSSFASVGRFIEDVIGEN
nr:UDP-glycosyltransferase 71K1-like [Malus domestica]